MAKVRIEEEELNRLNAAVEGVQAAATGIITELQEVQAELEQVHASTPPDVDITGPIGKLNALTLRLSEAIAPDQTDNNGTPGDGPEDPTTNGGGADPEPMEPGTNEETVSGG